MLKYLLLILTFVFNIYANEGKFVLLLGPSGVGKSTIIRHLKDLDQRFIYISPYTTRQLREGEVDKVHVTLEKIKLLENTGKLLTINQIYGIYYATPKDIIDSSLSKNKFPILDWPINNLDIMLKNYGNNLITIYIEPESLTHLEDFLKKDDRDFDGKRFSAGKKELEDYFSGKYDQFINKKIINYNGKDREIALKIYQDIIK